MSISMLQNALSASLEDASLGAEINPLTDDTVIEIDQVLEEVREEAGQVTGAEGAVDTLQEAEASLESLVAHLDAAVTAGGMSARSAVFYRSSLENATRRLPIGLNDFSVSVESFTGDSDRLSVTMEAAEGAKALLARVVEAIRKAWNTLKEHAIALWRKLFNAGVKLAAAGKALKKSADETKGSLADDAKTTGSSTLVSTGGKFDPIQTMIELGGALSGIQQSTVEGAAEVEKQSLKMIDGNYDRGGAAVAVYNAVDKPLPAKLPGGYTKKGALDAANPKPISYEKGEAKSEEVSLASAAEVSKIAGHITHVGLWLQAFDKKYYAKAAASVDKAIKYIATESAKAENDEAKAKAIKANGTHVNTLANLSRGVSAQFASIAGNACKAALSYGSASLKAHKA